jgi:hypothetical protein
MVARFPVEVSRALINKEAHTSHSRIKTMKPNIKTFPHLQVLARTLLAALAMLALSTTHTFAEGPLPAAILKKLDPQIVLALKKSWGQPPFDKPTKLEPDIPVKDDTGRVLVDVEASISTQLLNEVSALGGKVIKGFETATTFRAMVPLLQLETLAGREDIKFISVARPTITSGIKPTP